MNGFIQTKDITRIYLKVILLKIDRFLDFQMVSNSEKLHNWNNGALQYGGTEDLEIHIMFIKDLGLTFWDHFTKNKFKTTTSEDQLSLSVLSVIACRNSGL